MPTPARRSRSGSAGSSTWTRPTSWVGVPHGRAPRRRSGWPPGLGSSSTGTTSSRCTTRRACRRPPPRSSRAPRRRSTTRAAGARSAEVTSLGWSPILKKPIALASVPASHEPVGSKPVSRVDRRGAPRPGRRDRRPAAVPRPAAQAGLIPRGGRSGRPGLPRRYLKNSRRVFAVHDLFRQPTPKAVSIVRSSE